MKHCLKCPLQPLLGTQNSGWEAKPPPRHVFPAFPQHTETRTLKHVAFLEVMLRSPSRKLED